jgi:hypothetical protein
MGKRISDYLRHVRVLPITSLTSTVKKPETDDLAIVRWDLV